MQGSRLAERFASREADDPLNLKRVMPPQGAKTSQRAATPLHGFSLNRQDAKDAKNLEHQPIRLAPLRLGGEPSKTHIP
jgi:hypothetical protein